MCLRLITHSGFYHFSLALHPPQVITTSQDFHSTLSLFAFLRKYTSIFRLTVIRSYNDGLMVSIEPMDSRPPSYPRPRKQLTWKIFMAILFCNAHKTGRRAKRASKYTTEDWEAQKSEVTRLYNDNTLESVRDVMRKEHGLDAT